MRFLYLITIFFLINSCDQQGTDAHKNVPAANDSTVNQARDEVKLPSRQHEDSILLHISADILKSIKNRDFKKFVEYFHPLSGVRFTPYGFIDTVTARVLSKNDFLRLHENQQKIHWGFFDGSGDSIKLNTKNYFRRFVYDADFLNAEKITINKFSAAGNSLNNLTAIYPNCDFLEFYFSGFNPKYSGMDWKTLRLVFRNYDKKPYLVAIVHDQWTI